MTNFEFWKDEFKKIKTNKICVGKEGVPIPCDRASCRVCIFGDCIDDDTCFCHFDREIMKWLLSEHVEKPKLTKRERAFCEFVGKGYIVRNTFVGKGYIVRSTSGAILCYCQKPTKSVRSTDWRDDSEKEAIYVRVYNDDFFRFIRSDDDEPWAVEDLLKLEVQDE